ncbi:guanine deaminase [Limosilactobacillus sp.]|uniref:guanine deaminase n=1 Tax=Limosilactobacillus sp. TaxID=2773925 RepID=UPI003F012DCE
MESLVIRGNAFTAQDQYHVQNLTDCLVCIDPDGWVDRVLLPADRDYSRVLTAARQHHQLRELAQGEYLLPGFVDLHVHAPQWPQAGLALDRPLADWLNVYTFPLEARFSDCSFARKVYADFVRTLLAHGTTTAMMFGTIHVDANLVLVDECQQQGLRGYVGQVTMDNPDQTPDYYRDHSVKEALTASERFIQRVQAIPDPNDLVTPVITPRFVPSCTDAALAGLGRLAAKYDLPIQSHVSESNWESQYTIDRFGMHDAEVLDHFGLLTPRAVMAHGTQLTTGDMELLKQHQTTIAHCPISNIYFGNGVLPVQRLLKMGNKVGLGSDISGGYTPSLYHNIRQAVKSSRMLTDGVDSRRPAEQRGVANSQITAATAFYLATAGGAQALHLAAGRIAAGYRADLQVVQAHRTWGRSSAADVFERLMYQTETADIKGVYVNGRLVYEN